MADIDQRAQILAQKLQRAQISYTRTAQAREQQHAKILRGVRKISTPALIGIGVLAGLADALSIIDMGWIISWTIPLASWVVVRRINAMRAMSKDITAATQRLRRDEGLVKQRLASILPASEIVKLHIQEGRELFETAASSYIGTFIRDTLITQFIELIPGVSILPIYLGQVVKLIINHNVEHQKIALIVSPYERSLASVDKLERMEVNRLNELLILALQQRTESRPQRVQKKPRSSTTLVSSRPQPNPTADIRIPAPQTAFST
jgi:FtsH-binding integral membrane protein